MPTTLGTPTDTSQARFPLFSRDSCPQALSQSCPQTTREMRNQPSKDVGSPPGSGPRREVRSQPSQRGQAQREWGEEEAGSGDDQGDPDAQLAGCCAAQQSTYWSQPHAEEVDRGNDSALDAK